MSYLYFKKSKRLSLILILSFLFSFSVYSQDNTSPQNQVSQNPAVQNQAGQSGEISSSQLISPEVAQAIKDKAAGLPVKQSAPDLDNPPVYGQEYGKLGTPVPQSNPNLISVVYFFQYDKPSALANPIVNEWKKTLSGDVSFSSSLATSGNTFENYAARIYFALVLMNQESNVREGMLQAIEDNKLDMSSPIQVKTWLSNNGVNGADFQKAINTNQDIALSDGLIDTTRQYEVQVTPTIVIDGRYWIKASLTMTPARFVKIADFVLSVVKHDRQKGGQS